MLLLQKSRLWSFLEKYYSCIPAPKAEECFHFQMMHFASAAAQASLTQRIVQYFLSNKYFIYCSQVFHGRTDSLFLAVKQIFVNLREQAMFVQSSVHCKPIPVMKTGFSL